MSRLGEKNENSESSKTRLELDANEYIFKISEKTSTNKNHKNLDYSQTEPKFLYKSRKETVKVVPTRSSLNEIPQKSHSDKDFKNVS